MKKIVILFVLASVMFLAACAAPGGAATSAAATPTVGVVNTNYADALPISSQLALGTIMLKGTPNEVTVDQAAKLLPLWQAMQGLTNSTTPSAVEVNAVVNQVQQTMQPAQLEAIANLKITQTSMLSSLQQLGLNTFPSSQNGTPVARTPGATTGSGRNAGEGFTGPPGGVIIEGGPGGGAGGFGGGGFGGLPTGTVAPSVRETAVARATQRAEFGNPMLYNAVISYLNQVSGK